MARAARRLVQARRRRAGGALPQALAAEAQRLPGGYRRGDLFPRFRSVREIDGQHHQCGCGQRDVVYAISSTAFLTVSRIHFTEECSREDAMTEQRIAGDIVSADNEKRVSAVRADYEALGAKLARDGIDIDT